MRWKTRICFLFSCFLAFRLEAGTADSTQGMLTYGVLILFLLLILGISIGIDKLRTWLPTGGFGISFS